MDAIAMIIPTVPIIFPVITQLGFNLIWFAVIIVMTVELVLIHPPVGISVFVVKSVVQEVGFATIFKGMMPFIATGIAPRHSHQLPYSGAMAAVAYALSKQWGTPAERPMQIRA